MKHRCLCLLLVLCLLPVGCLAEAGCTITLDSYGGGFESRTLATVTPGAEYSYTLQPPAGYILPESVSIHAGRTLMDEGDDTYTYDADSGEISFVAGAITDDVTIRAAYPAGTVLVNGVAIYQNGRVNTYLQPSVKFDPTTETLTLRDATIDRVSKNLFGAEYGIYTDLRDLKILLAGENTILMPTAAGKESYGIYAVGGLCFCAAEDADRAALTITAGEVSAESRVISCGVYAGTMGDGSFDGVRLTAAGGAACATIGSAKSCGLWIEDLAGRLSITDSTVTLDGGQALAGTAAYSAGLVIGGYEEGSVTVSNSALYTCSGHTVGAANAVSYGADLAQALVLTGGSLRAVAGTAESPAGTAVSNGLYSTAVVALQNTELTAAGGEIIKASEKDGNSAGLFAGGLTMDAASLTVQGDDGALLLLSAPALGQERWYQWTDQKGGPYSREIFHPKGEQTYLHLLPADMSALPVGQFSDVHGIGHWATDPIDFVVEKGLFQGTDDRLFSPDIPTTRGMAATILWRMAGQPDGQAAHGFLDIPADAYYAPAVAWCARNGIITGLSEEIFAPNAAVTREQLVTMLWRYAKHHDIDVSLGENTNILSYNDAFDVSEYAIPAMQWACGEGIIGGYNGNLMPKGHTKRCEAAAMLTRFIRDIEQE